MTPVRIPPMLRDQVEGQREVLGEGETVRQVLEDVATRYPALRANLFEQGDLSPFVNVYVGRDDVRTLEGLDTPVGASSVILLPAMAGGSATNPRYLQQLVADVYSQTIMSAHKLVCMPDGLIKGLIIVRARLR